MYHDHRQKDATLRRHSVQRKLIELSLDFLRFAGLTFEHKISFTCQDGSLSQPVVLLEILRMDYKIPSPFFFFGLSSSVAFEAYVTCRKTNATHLSVLRQKLSLLSLAVAFISLKEEKYCELSHMRKW